MGKLSLHIHTRTGDFSGLIYYTISATKIACTFKKIKQCKR